MEWLRRLLGLPGSRGPSRTPPTVPFGEQPVFHCPACRTPVADGTTHCPSCGAALP